MDRPHWKTSGATSTLGCHWNTTGWCQHPVVFQWRSSVNLHNWNTLEDHWKAIGRPLEAHWLPTILSPVAYRCTLGSKFQAHWISTGRPLAQGKGSFTTQVARDTTVVSVMFRCISEAIFPAIYHAISFAHLVNIAPKMIYGCFGSVGSVIRYGRSISNSPSKFTDKEKKHWTKPRYRINGDVISICWNCTCYNELRIYIYMIWYVCIFYRFPAT